MAYLNLPTELEPPRRYGEPGAMFFTAKRLIDIAGACVGLIALSPIMLLAAAWIRTVDRGPAIYKQWRVGRNGWLFLIYKFRTMRIDAEEPGTARWAINCDDRLIPGGAFLRKCHIDELPQLWNILRGEMSLVGPRPERPEMFDQLSRAMPRFEDRLLAKPGLTGLAQVCNGYTNDTDGARRKLALDLHYLRSRSLLNEAALLLATVPKVWDRASV